MKVAYVVAAMAVSLNSASAGSASKTTTTSSATSTTSTELKKRLLSQARRLDEDDNKNNYDNGIDEELANYSLKMIKCDQEDSLGSNQNGYKQYGVVTFRMCPSDSCSDDTDKGCTSGYADFAVSLEMFVEYYIEDQRDNMQWDDNNNMDNFAECTQYKGENNNNNNNNNGNYQSYYVGPACTSDGKDVRMAVFNDNTCYKLSQKSFEDLSNGWTLPFSNGGMISSQCVPCAGDNDGDGQQEIKDLCVDLYEAAPLKCEANWEIKHYYWDSMTEIYRFGLDNTGCSKINWLGARGEEPFGEWASIFAMTFLVVFSVGGAIWYTHWWKQKKATLEKIEDEEDSHADYHEHDSNYHQHSEPEPETDTDNPSHTFA